MLDRVTTQFVSKQHLVDQIRKIVADRESGVLSIVTEAQRSVVLRFYEGRLTQTIARGKDVGEAIQLLAQSQSLRFGFVAAKGEIRKELMPAKELADRIEAGTPVVRQDGGSVLPTKPVADKGTPFGDFKEELVREVLIELAVKHIGPMADLIIEQAIESSENLEELVDAVAMQIPDSAYAGTFRDLALERIRRG